MFPELRQFVMELTPEEIIYLLYKNNLPGYKSKTTYHKKRTND